MSSIKPSTRNQRLLMVIRKKYHLNCFISRADRVSVNKFFHSLDVSNSPFIEEEYRLGIFEAYKLCLSKRYNEFSDENFIASFLSIPLPYKLPFHILLIIYISFNDILFKNYFEQRVIVNNQIIIKKDLEILTDKVYKFIELYSMVSSVNYYLYINGLASNWYEKNNLLILEDFPPIYIYIKSIVRVQSD